MGKVHEIEKDIEAIQLGYDQKGYVSTNEADEIINHCRSLIVALKDSKKEIRKVKRSTRHLNMTKLYEENLTLAQENKRLKEFFKIPMG